MIPVIEQESLIRYLGVKKENQLMEGIGIGAQIIVILIVVHLILGFGYMMYKLSPRKKDKEEKE